MLSIYEQLSFIYKFCSRSLNLKIKMDISVIELLKDLMMHVV